MLPIKDLLNPEPAQAGSSTDANTTVNQTESQGKICKNANSKAKPCSNLAEEGKLKCRPCLERDNQDAADRRERRKNEGTCTRCKEKLDTRTGTCKSCSGKLQNYNREYWKANKNN